MPYSTPKITTTQWGTHTWKTIGNALAPDNGTKTTGQTVKDVEETWWKVIHSNKPDPLIWNSKR